MEKWNRRDAVRGLGAVGLGVLGSGGASALAEGPSPAATSVLQQIRLTGRHEREFLERLGRGAARPSRLPEKALARPSRAVEPEVVVKRGPDGTTFAQGLRFLCDPRQLNRFVVAGVPLSARRFCYSAEEICWSPGAGAPVYGAYAPRYEQSLAAYYPEARWHQVVPVAGERLYFNGCQADDVCECDSSEAIAFDVNDSHYDDNVGYYRVTIWSWT